MGMQWDGLLRNLGDWYGGFERIEPHTGDRLGREPSLVSLRTPDGGKTVVQRIRRASGPIADWEDPNVQGLLCDRQLFISSLGRGFMALPSGAFSQGSTQLGPFAEFGAELGLIEGDRRVRLVMRFDRGGALEPMTLMPEWRGEGPAWGDDESGSKSGSGAIAFGALGETLLAALVGTWRGETMTVYPDFRPSDRGSCELTVVRSGSDGSAIEQCLTFEGAMGSGTVRSRGHFDGHRIRFEGQETPGKPAVQVLLLKDGISANCPEQVQLRQPFVLELGWLLAPNRRRRLVRHYDASGEWTSLTEIVEEKV